MPCLVLFSLAGAVIRLNFCQFLRSRRLTARLYLVQSSFRRYLISIPCPSWQSMSPSHKSTFLPLCISAYLELLETSRLRITRENLKYERKITMPTPIRSSIFGVPLEELMGYNGEKGGIPRVVKDAVQYLRDTGMCRIQWFIE